MPTLYYGIHVDDSLEDQEDLVHYPWDQENSIYDASTLLGMSTDGKSHSDFIYAIHLF